VKKIVEGSFQSFQTMYRPLLQEYIAEGLLKTPSHGQRMTFQQVCPCLAFDMHNALWSHTNTFDYVYEVACINYPTCLNAFLVLPLPRFLVIT
jgi:translocator assembly and maintenance protein 41